MHPSHIITDVMGFAVTALIICIWTQCTCTLDACETEDEGLYEASNMEFIRVWYGIKMTQPTGFRSLICGPMRRQHVWVICVYSSYFSISYTLIQKRTEIGFASRKPERIHKNLNFVVWDFELKELFNPLKRNENAFDEQYRQIEMISYPCIQSSFIHMVWCCFLDAFIKCI